MSTPSWSLHLAAWVSSSAGGAGPSLGVGRVRSSRGLGSLCARATLGEPPTLWASVEGWKSGPQPTGLVLDLSKTIWGAMVSGPRDPLIPQTHSEL